VVVDFRTRLQQAFRGDKEGKKSVELPILIYWGICAILGIAFLHDWLFAWNIGETLSRPWLVVYLIITLIISQVIYFIVACDGGRSIHWNSTLLFTIGNGIFEVFAFALVYRLGEVLGSLVIGALFPTAASVAGFVLGIIFFIIYGGLIHGMFWIKLLPPHFKSTPMVLAIRKYRPLAEVFLVTGWSFCFWLGQDIWTVIFIHIVLDLCMMLRVRPVLFGSPEPKRM
jgi:chlorophyllide a hydrolase